MIRPARRFAPTAAAMAVIGALVLTSCAETGGGSVDELKDEGSIKVGFAGEEPYSFENDEGELDGATIALHEEIFGEMGIDEVDGQLTEWDSLIPGLNAGRYDVVSAGMSILPERCEQADFSIPEIMYTTAFLVKKGNPMDLQDMQDVKDSGAKFAAMSGAIEDGYAKTMKIKTLNVGSPEDGLQAVKSGRADVFALTAISLRAMAEKNADAPIEVTEPFTAVVDGVEQVGAGATVFDKDADELREAYNEEAEKIIGDPEEFKRVLGPYGFTEAERPKGDITTEQLCAGDLPKAE
ncbi:MAG: ectoine/hydroxyectoine ABC transporter substrate-binding protein EhuB [Nocardioides sp.]|nr:ectoine/hydroxyectoine ABC transporter substrate-binding protein EhuB [Nocardioides sp.]